MSLPVLSLPLLFVIVVWGGWLHYVTAAGHYGLCRRLKFSTKIDGYALRSHMIKKFNLSTYVGPSVRSACTHRCIMDHVCVSVNIGPPTDEKFICELSDSDHNEHPEELKKREGFLYIGTENPCFSNPCLHDSICLNGYTDKQYLCDCQAGYTGEQCKEDIDECAIKIDNCSLHAICNNSEGSFNCSCKKGFDGDGINCTDIDECVQDTHNCSKDGAMCNNTEGSFNCTCKPGFVGDGYNCTDIDECFLGSIKKGSKHVHCNNTAGSFKCACRDGYFGDGHNCTPFGYNSQWILCYRQSSHGDTFHEKCDGKNNTVTIVQEKEFVFGGYTDIAWESPTNGKYGSTSKAFIFSLHNNENLAPFKSMVNNIDRAINRYKFYGPTFGTSDLFIARTSNPGYEAAKTDFGIDYFVPENVTNPTTILAGVYQFHPDEVEVFYLN